MNLEQNIDNLKFFTENYYFKFNIDKRIIGDLLTELSKKKMV